MSKFALLFLTFFFGGILAALFVVPTAALVVYQMVYFLNPDNRWWAASIPGLRYSFITVLLMMLVLGMKYKELSARSPWTKQPVFKWLVALVVLYLFMYQHAIVPGYHRSFMIDFIKIVIIMALAYKLIPTQKALDAVLWTYVIGATYIGYVATVTGRNADGRVEGIGMIDTGGDSNYTSAALVPALVLLMYYAWLGNKKMKLFSALCGAFIANGLVLINSRGAFLGAVVGVGFFLCYMLFSKYQRQGQRGMAMLIILAGLGGGWYVTDETFWARMSTLTNVEDGSESGSHRIEFWLATFDVMRDHPLGVGIGGYQALSRNYLPEEYFEHADSKVVHSTWFQSLGELGWPGPIVLLCLIGSALRLSHKTKKYLLEQDSDHFNPEAYFKMLALEGGLLAYLVAATFIDRLRAEVLYWMIMFIASAANVYYLQYIQAKDTSVRRKTRGRLMHRSSIKEPLPE